VFNVRLHFIIFIALISQSEEIKRPVNFDTYVYLNSLQVQEKREHTVICSFKSRKPASKWKLVFSVCVFTFCC
jgi:hypothetical protein